MNEYSIEQIVKQINSIYATEAEETAARYAIKAHKDANYDGKEMDDNCNEKLSICLEFHLGFLVEEGANFDMDKATKIALEEYRN